MGLAPQKPRLAGVKLVFLGFFVLTNSLRLAEKPLKTVLFHQNDYQ